MEQAHDPVIARTQRTNTTVRTFQYGGTTLRIRQLDILAVQHWYRLIAVMWASLSMLLAVTAVWAWLAFNVWTVRATSIAAVIAPVVYAGYARRSLSFFPLVQYSSLLVFVVVAMQNAEFGFTRFTYLFIPTAVCWLVCIYFCSQKAPFKLMQSILVGQVIMILLKVDGVLLIDWDSVLIPTFAAQIILFFSAASVGIAFLVVVFRYTDQYSYRKHGFAYCSLIALVLAVLLLFVNLTVRIPVQDKFNFLKIIAAVGSGLCVLPIIAYFLCENHLLVFSTGTSSADNKTNAQPALQELPVKDIPTLKEISSNYYSTDSAEQPSETTIPLHNGKQRPDCLICLSDQSSIVAMPCGHLTSCMACIKYYVERGSTKCLLCKKQMERLYFIEKSPELSEATVQSAYLIIFK